jgi:haloalkane dehalogenase
MPGGLVTPAFAESFANGLTNCKVVHIGPGIHYVEEDNPTAIGSGIHDWLAELKHT